MSNIALESEQVEVQQMISCLQVAKPNCEPTPNETSEFLWGKISIQLVLPDPQTAEEFWTTEELQRITQAFGLPGIRQNNEAEPLLLSSINVDTQTAGPTIEDCDVWFPQHVPSTGYGNVVESVAGFIMDTFLSHTQPAAQPKIADCFVITDSVGCKIRVEWNLEFTDTSGKVHKIPMAFDYKCPQHVSLLTKLKNAIMQFASDGNVIGKHPPAPALSGETPILTSADPARIWMNAVMNEIDGGKYFDPNPDNFMQQVSKYANDIRERDDADWAFVVFIVDASNDEDGMFADGAIAWSEIGGPFMVLSNRLGGYGFDNLDKIFLHEFLHQFYALDEYHGSFDNNTISGYLGIENENHEDAFGGTPFSGDPSIMKRIQLPPLDPQNDFIIDRIPACAGHWTTNPSCEVEVNGQKIGAKMDTKVPCQAATGLTRGCFMLDWDNQAFGGTAPFFWFNSINVGPQGPLKVGETYRYGMKFLVNPLPQETSRAAMEVYTDSGLLIAARDLHSTRNRDQQSLPIFEDQYVQFTIPANTQRVDIFFTRCFPNVGEICSINAYDNFVIIADWAFTNTISESALKMLGFNDEDQDGLIDPIDTTPDLKIDNFGPQPIALEAVLDDLNTCTVTLPSGVYAFTNWQVQDVSLSPTLGGCRNDRIALITGPNPTVTASFEKIGDGTCPPPCLPPTPQSNEDLVDVEADNNINAFTVAQPTTTHAFLKVQASDGTNPINGLRVKVFPPDLAGASDGITPFTRIYAVGYNAGVQITGHAFDVPLQNMNPIGSGNSVTINDIINVQYCVHEVSTCNWLDANPSDGAFNQAGESFDFIPSVKPGLNTITVRANNTIGNLSNLFTTNLLVLPSECVGKTFAKVIVGTEQNDVLVGMSGADLIFGLEGNDEIRGKSRADCLLGGEGNDIIYGNRGADTILGDEGDDTLLGGLGNDKLDGGDDFDTCKGGAGTNTKKNCEA